MEVMGAWQQHYQRAVYIDLGIGNGSNVEKKAQDEAARRGWNFERMAGDIILIRDLLEGNWQIPETQPAQNHQAKSEDRNSFLVVPPGKKKRLFSFPTLTHFPDTLPAVRRPDPRLSCLHSIMEKLFWYWMSTVTN
jgi:hypothetical protein